MVVSASWYRYGLQYMSACAKVAWTTDTIRVALGASTYTPNTASHQFWSDVSANEVTGTGYTASGVAASAKTVSISGSVIILDADDVSWVNSSIAARYAWIFGSASNLLLGLTDFGQTGTTLNGTFQITWSPSGILNFIAQ